MFAILVTVAIAAIAFLTFFRWFERANVYHPSRTFRATPGDVGTPVEEVTFTTWDGVGIHAWFMTPSKASAAAAPRPAVILSHGNGGNLGDRLDTYRLLLDLGLEVLAYDYRGYGRSDGSPSEEGTALDAEAALEWLSRRGTPEDRVLALGESLGGAVAAELALRHPQLRGLILQSTFTSVPNLGAELFPFLPVRTLARIRYDTRSKLPRIHVPVLILHSRSDSLVGFHHAVANHAAANAPKWLVEIDGDHNDQPASNPDQYTAAIRAFMAACDQPRR